MNKKNSMRNEEPRYQQIAIEIATRISSGEYKVGQKIFARSSLASQHGVSAETARRAICVLADLGIVISEKGSGVTIASHESAQKFVEQQEKRTSINEVRKNIIGCIERQKTDIEYLNEKLNELLQATEHFRSMNPFVPFQEEISSKCLFLGKNLAELNLWQYTGATVMAIHRDNKTILSPGPYMQLKEGDILFFITKDSGPETLHGFLYSNREELETEE